VHAEVERLRAAIREFGAPSDVEPRQGDWQDVAVWFGSLLMLGPRATRGVGAFASVALISRVWSRRQFRVEDRMRHVLRATLDLLAEDLEDRAAYDASVDELADRVHDLEVAAADDAEQAGRTETQPPFPFPDGDALVLGPECFISHGVISYQGKNYYSGRESSPDSHVALTGLQDYLDDSIRRWRVLRDEAGTDDERVLAHHYIDAFQAVRDSIIGTVLPETEGPQSDEEAGQPSVPRELKLMTTRVADVLVRKGGGSIGVRYEPDDREDMRWSVMGVLGRESEDSPMAGGAIHGLGATMIDALDQALREARG
jgi:hypothetical protein